LEGADDILTGKWRQNNGFLHTSNSKRKIGDVESGVEGIRESWKRNVSGDENHFVVVEVQQDFVGL
jgi:hypothetical protein